MDTAPEEQFTALCETARDLFQAPVAVVSLVDETDQWFKARCGIALTGTARSESFCTHTVTSDEILVVEDAARDPRFRDSLLVKGSECIRFYAGAPLEVAAGLQVGSLCIMDRVPRTFTAKQRGQLRNLALIVTAQLRLRKTERLLREREAGYRLLADNTTDMIVRADLDGTRRYVSPGSKALLGYSPEALIGTRARDFVHPDDADEFHSLLARISSGQLDRAITQQRYRHSDGSWVWVEVNFSLFRDDGQGGASGYIATVRDISKRKEVEARLDHLARHDPLTGLPNRLQFRECLQREIARAQRSHTSFALHCLDLDRFKAINDNFGHHAGDRLLQSVADRLRAAVRVEDVVARLGGDEFVIIQTGAGRPHAITLAERLVAALSSPFDLDGQERQIGVSVGIALAHGGSIQGEALHTNADKALYAAKAAGRCTFRFAADIDARAQGRDRGASAHREESGTGSHEPGSRRVAE